MLREKIRLRKGKKVLNESTVGLSLKQKFIYSWRDLILYNLNVGVGQGKLDCAYEEGLKAVPTFGVIPCTETSGMGPYDPQPQMPARMIPGLRTNETLRMDRGLILRKPIAVKGALMIGKMIGAVYNRGEGKDAKIQVDVIERDGNSEPVFTNTMDYSNRWARGFDRPKTVRNAVEIPDREPDHVCRGGYPLDIPLLYRLTGDTYPLHADPKFATRCGFEELTVHGFCNLRYVRCMMAGALFPGEPERMVPIENQSRGVAMSGEGFFLHIWGTGSGEAIFRMAKDTNRKAVLDFGQMTWV